MGWVSAYPIASFSAVGFYLLVLILALPVTRAKIAPYLTHPIPPKQAYLAGFDTLRGLAALYVAAGHCWYFGNPAFNSSQPFFPPLAFAHKAVPMFAALSGFLIYRSVLSINSIERLREYALRRFFRIYPVYALGILVALAFGQYAARGTTTWLSFLVSDIFMLRMFWAPIFANPVTWSLYVETIFYMVLPIALLTLGRQRFCIFAMVALVGFLIADFPGRDHAIWLYFLVGILASEAADRLGWPSLPLFVIGCVLLTLDVLGPRFDWGAKLKTAGAGMTVGLTLAMFLILACLPQLRRVGRALNVLPLRVLGVVSYSLFLIHPFYILANFPQIGMFGGPPKQPLAGVMTMPAWYLPLVFLPGALTWSVACFLLVERPGMRFGRQIIAGTRQEPIRRDTQLYWPPVAVDPAELPGK